MTKKQYAEKLKAKLPIIILWSINDNKKINTEIIKEKITDTIDINTNSETKFPRLFPSKGTLPTRKTIIKIIK